MLCSGGTWVTTGSSTTCPGNADGLATPLLLFLQGAGANRPRDGCCRCVEYQNEDYALFAQDKWQIRPNFTLNYGLRWEAQIFPDVNGRSGRHRVRNIPERSEVYRPTVRFRATKTCCSLAVGFAWDVSRQRQICHACEFWSLQCPPEHADTGRIDHDERRPAADDRRRWTCQSDIRPTWPALATANGRAHVLSGTSDEILSRVSAAFAFSTGTTKIRESTRSTSVANRRSLPTGQYILISRIQRAAI